MKKLTLKVTTSDDQTVSKTFDKILDSFTEDDAKALVKSVFPFVDGVSAEYTLSTYTSGTVSD